MTETNAGNAILWEDLGLDPVALDLGFFELRWYSLAYLAGIFIGYWYLLKLLRQPGAPMVPQDPGNAGYASTFSRPSIDQVAAAHFAANPETRTAFRSLELGVSRRVIYGEGTTLGYLSHNGPDNVNKPIYSTQELYRRVFPSDAR